MLVYIPMWRHAYNKMLVHRQVTQRYNGMVHVKNKRILSHVSTKNILKTTESENNRTMLSHDRVSILFFLFFIGEGPRGC